MTQATKTALIQMCENEVSRRTNLIEMLNAEYKRKTMTPKEYHEHFTKHSNARSKAKKLIAELEKEEVKE